MDNLFIYLFFIIILGLVAIIFLLTRKKKESSDSSFLMLQGQIDRISQVLDNKLSESNKSFQEQYSQSFKIIRFDGFHNEFNGLQKPVF